MQLLQLLLQPLAGPLHDRLLLPLAPLRLAVQARLALLVGLPIDPHPHPRGRLHGPGLVRIELPLALPAGHHVAPALLPQPLDVGRGRDPLVEHHDRSGRRLQRLQHAGQRAALGHVACQHLRTPHEAAGVQHQAQREQRAVAALLLGAAPPRLRLALGLALEIGVGEIHEGHRGRLAEQSRGALEEIGFQCLAMPQQAVAGAVESAQAHAFEVAAEQFAEAAALAQPAPGGEFGGRGGHAAHEQAQGGVALGAGQAQLLQQGRQAELLGGPQGDVLDADAAGPRQLQRIHVDALQVGLPAAGLQRCGLRGGIGERDTLRQQARADALGFGLDGGGALEGQQLGLGVEDLLDALGE